MNNPTNWYGVVEENIDPLKSARVRVRIFSFHNLDKIILPTKDLPWAQTTSNGMLLVPRIGEWVTGFFLDGTDGQFPVVTGIINGINPPTLFKQNPNGPQYPAIDGPTKGKPSIAGGAYKVDPSTSIFWINKNLIHACDISYEVDQATAAIRNFFGTIVQAIRLAINAIISALNLDPTGIAKRIAETIRAVVRIIKQINDVLKTIVRAIRIIILIARKVKAMIDYILSLPARWLAFFKECLGRLYKILAAGLLSLFPDLGGGFDIGIADVVAAVREGVAAIEETTSLVKEIILSPQQLMKALTEPTSEEEQLEAGAVLATYAADVTSSDSVTNTLAVSMIDGLENIKKIAGQGSAAIKKAADEESVKIKTYVDSISTNSLSTVKPAAGTGWSS